MRNYTSAIVCLLLFVSTCCLATDTIEGLPVHSEKLGDKGIRLWIGDHISSTAVCALATEKGIVVIDTTECWQVDRKLREIIARELGRDDFIYLINTHEHADHVGGNQVYSDCEIIAHENCASGIKAVFQDMPRVLEWYKGRIAELENEIQAKNAPDSEIDRYKEELQIANAIVRDIGTVEITLPTKIFTDRMTLDLGDMTLELYFAGGTHTASDIWIFVPEEGLLFTGDTMADVWLTDTPGCLRAFMMRQGVERNMPLMLSHWKSLIDRKDEIKDLIPGHWNGDLTFDGFVNRYNYAKTMYEGITTAANNGEKLEEQFRAFALQTRFPELVGSPGIEQFTHYGSILALWSDATGAVSAATALGDMVEEMGIDKAVDKIRAAHVNESRDYFFLEADINQLGYRFMNQELMPEAIAVFKLNVEFFPESWNVYDSLAEACVKSGDTDKAIKLYNKSLELNPDNENGKQMLARIKSQN